MYEILDLYKWLSQRLSQAFPDDVLVNEIRERVIYAITEALKNPLDVATAEDELSSEYDYMARVDLGADKIIGNRDGIQDLE